MKPTYVKCKYLCTRAGSSPAIVHALSMSDARAAYAKWAGVEPIGGTPMKDVHAELLSCLCEFDADDYLPSDL